MRIHVLHSLVKIFPSLPSFRRGPGLAIARQTPQSGRLALCVIVAVFFALSGNAEAQDLSFSLSSPYCPANASGYKPTEDDLFIRAGLVAGLSPKIEMDIGVTLGIIPDPLQDIQIDGGIAYSIFSAGYLSVENATAHINALIGVGFAAGFHRPGQDNSSERDALTASYHIFIECTPLAVGSLFYGKRNRIGTFGIQYDFLAGEVSYFLDLLSIDIRLAPHPKVR